MVDIRRRPQFVEDAVDERIPVIFSKHPVRDDIVVEQFNEYRQSVLVEFSLRRVTQAQKGGLFQEMCAVRLNGLQVTSRVVERSNPCTALVFKRTVGLNHQQESSEVSGVPIGGILIQDVIDIIGLDRLLAIRILWLDYFDFGPFL